MPLPAEYQRATDKFYSFLTEVRDQANFGSTHQAYTMVQGVFQVFRRRLQLTEAIGFANALPALLRALFIADWDTMEAVKPFGDLSDMNREVKQLRPEHNFSTNTAIQDVGSVLKNHVDESNFSAALGDLPEEARQFWHLK